MKDLVEPVPGGCDPSVHRASASNNTSVNISNKAEQRQFKPAENLLIYI